MSRRKSDKPDPVGQGWCDHRRDKRHPNPEGLAALEGVNEEAD